MSYALVRVSRTLPFPNNFSALDQLFSGVFNNIKSWGDNHHIRSWNQFTPTMKNDIDSENSDMGDHLLKSFLRRKLPEYLVTGKDSGLIFEKASVKINKFDLTTDLLEFEFRLIPEPLTLLVHFGHKILIAQGDQIPFLIAKKPIQHTFLLSLDQYDISEFQHMDFRI
ncbi:MAG: hypothetical protein JNK79_00155 [Chitinophagaceae bacterium]|nr:hypothetical protein [Chitinophagaceae bacterium]